MTNQKLINDLFNGAVCGDTMVTLSLKWGGFVICQSLGGDGKVFRASLYPCGFNYQTGPRNSYTVRREDVTDAWIASNQEIDEVTDAVLRSRPISFCKFGPQTSTDQKSLLERIEIIERELWCLKTSIKELIKDHA